MTTPLVQAIARAQYALWQDEQRRAGFEPLPWEDGPREGPLWLESAQAALTAITEAGYAVVPVEPSEAMTLIGDGARVARDDAAEIYRAMISATNTGKGGA